MVARSFRFALAFTVVLLLFVTVAWSRTTTRQQTPNRSKAREVSGQSPRKTTARKATTRKTTSKSRRRRGRRYRQVWTASTYADSTSADRIEGDDPAVRAAAVEALGLLNGSVVVVDPNNGRVLSMVNQPLALGNGYQPCSTIKLPIALAALHEGIIDKDTRVRLGRRWSLNLTDALAKSNNPYFETLGRRIGFAKVAEYAQTFGFGELAGYNIEGEHVGTFPSAPPQTGVGRMCSFGEQVDVTPLQLAAFVSAVANGGTLYYLQYPRNDDLATFEPHIKRQLDIQALLPDLREGMLEAVTRGTAKRLDNPYSQVFGKTGTCSEGGTRLGWFAAYENNGVGPGFVVIVLLRGGRPTVGPLAAEVAGRIYRTLHERNFYAQYREQQEQLNRPSPNLVPATGILAH